MPDYRDDDRRDCGYCPHCAKPLTGVTRAALGYCEQHGWVWAEWTTPKHRVSCASVSWFGETASACDCRD